MPTCNKSVVPRDDPEVLEGFAGLAGGLAHELKNPLSAIVMAGKILRRGLPGLTGEHAILLEAILKESGRLNSILEDFLKFLRPATPRCAQHDLSRLMLEARDAFDEEPRESHRNASPEVLGHFPTKSQVLVDREQIDRVFQALLAHASEARAAGSPVEMSLREDGEGFLVSIFHEGEEADPETLFRPFAQERRKGSGLELPICKRIVEAHGGHMWVEPGKGARVGISFWLPEAREAPRPA